MPFNRLRVEGRLGNEGERWSVGMAYATTGGNAVSDSGDLTDWCNEVHDLWASANAYIGTLKNMIGSTSNVDLVSAYYYASTDGAALASGESSRAAVAGSGSMVLPYQSALVATMGTGRPGRSFRGRQYWPFPTAVMTNGKISTSSITLVARAQAIRDYLVECGDLALTLPGLVPVVVSKTAAAVTPVTSVRVGDVMDTQRRRRDSLIENFGVAGV